MKIKLTMQSEKVNNALEFGMLMIAGFFLLSVVVAVVSSHLWQKIIINLNWAHDTVRSNRPLRVYNFISLLCMDVGFAFESDESICDTFAHVFVTNCWNTDEKLVHTDSSRDICFSSWTTIRIICYNRWWLLLCWIGYAVAPLIMCHSTIFVQSNLIT